MQLRILLLVLLCSCSSGESRIAESSTDISSLAHSSRARFEIIYKEAGKPDADTNVIQSESLGGIDEQGKILEAINAVIRALPDVQNVESKWLSTLAYLIGLLFTIAFIVLMFQSGIGAWIKSLFAAFTRKRNDA
jgi:hypothetical protein